MAVWPESAPSPLYPLRVTPVWSNNIVDLGDGGEQRRTTWLYPKFDVVVSYDVLTAAGAETLWAFYMARKGTYESFHIYDLALLTTQAFSQTRLYCATTDGTTDTYDLPGRTTSAQTVYVDGVADGSASILSGGGDSGSDRITWAAAPAEGGIISASFTGYLRMSVRFEQDRLTRDLFMTNLYSFGSIKLKGVKE